MLQIASLQTQLANGDTHTAELKKKLADRGKCSDISFLKSCVAFVLSLLLFQCCSLFH